MENNSNSKVQNLHDILKIEIEQGVYKPGAKLPSVRNMAEKYGINKSTVVTVLATLSNEGLIQTEAGKGAYVLQRKSEPKQVAILFFDESAPIRVDTEILRHIQKNIKNDYFLSLHDTSQDYGVFEKKVATLIENKVDGIIAIPPKFYTPKQEEVAYFNNLIQEKVPLVFIIRNIEGVDADFYSMDLNSGIQKAVKYLVSSGKKKICLVKHDSKKFIDEELDGLRSACNQYGIEVNERYILDYNYHGSIDALEGELSSILDEIDAIIAPDTLLCSLRELIRRSGKAIPEELSIVGINDVMSQYFSPSLTALSFPVESIGIYAANTIMARIEGAKLPQKIFKNFSPELIIRET